jgi:DNA polymerase-3 subunit gamma/tau
VSILPDGSPLDLPADAPRSEYVVVARRYRPQTFAELVGQEHVARALTGAIASNRVGHAYLFAGARGVGKTSAARILAKALNCVQGPTPTPCNECDICRSISTGEDVDVLEIDGASNRGIDEIRELRQNINIRPSRARYKIYIIDEVHMLTTPAFNALLKTLEEPPQRVKFIFCTTEAEKIPITILSRCQRFDFAGIQTDSIARRLAQIAAAEGIEAEPQALELLARRASGSMRDSQSLLEQLLSFGDRKITVGEVHALLGTAATGRVTSVVGHLLNADAAAVLDDLDRALAEGVDVSQLVVQLLDFFRDAMVAAVGADASLINAPTAEHELVTQTASRLGVDTILAVLQILDQTLARMRYSTQPRTLAELALVRIARLENLTALAELIQSARSGLGTLSPATASPAPAEVAQTGSDLKKKSVERAEASRSNTTAERGVLTQDNALAIWQRAVASIPGTVGEFAKTCHAVRLEGSERLVVSFLPQYSYNRTLCERPERRAKLEHALQLVAGQSIRLDFEVLPEPAGMKSAPPASRAPSASQRLIEKAEHPMVKRAIELFAARPTRIDEPQTEAP